MKWTERHIWAGAPKNNIASFRFLPRPSTAKLSINTRYERIDFRVSCILAQGRSRDVCDERRKRERKSDWAERKTIRTMNYRASSVFLTYSRRPGKISDGTVLNIHKQYTRVFVCRHTRGPARSDTVDHVSSMVTEAIVKYDPASRLLRSGPNFSLMLLLYWYLMWFEYLDECFADMLGSEVRV